MKNKFATLEQCVFIYAYKSIAYADKVVGHAILTKRFLVYLTEKVDENWPKPLMFFVQPRHQVRIIKQGPSLHSKLLKFRSK